MLSFAHFERALPLSEFLSTFGTVEDRVRWDAGKSRVHLIPEQTTSLSGFTRRMNLMILAGAWCHDCSTQCPIFERFAEVSPKILVRYLDRDAHKEIAEELKVNGGGRVPVIVVYSEDGFEVCRMGDRTHTGYRKLMGTLLPDFQSLDREAWERGFAADWLRELERSQWMLRLSPRLKRLHGD